jgi:hypothetical protein
MFSKVRRVEGSLSLLTNVLSKTEANSTMRIPSSGQSEPREGRGYRNVHTDSYAPAKAALYVSIARWRAILCSTMGAT